MLYFCMIGFGPVYTLILKLLLFLLQVLSALHLQLYVNYAGGQPFGISTKLWMCKNSFVGFHSCYIDFSI